MFPAHLGRFQPAVLPTSVGAAVPDSLGSPPCEEEVPTDHPKNSSRELLVK